MKYWISLETQVREATLITMLMGVMKRMLRNGGLLDREDRQ